MKNTKQSLKIAAFLKTRLSFVPRLMWYALCITYQWCLISGAIDVKFFDIMSIFWKFSGEFLGELLGQNLRKSISPASSLWVKPAETFVLISPLLIIKKQVDPATSNVVSVFHWVDFFVGKQYKEKIVEFSCLLISIKNCKGVQWILLLFVGNMRPFAQNDFLELNYVVPLLNFCLINFLFEKAVFHQFNFLNFYVIWNFLWKCCFL